MLNRIGFDYAQEIRDRDEGPDPFISINSEYTPYNDGYRDLRNIIEFEGIGENAGEIVNISDALEYALDKCGLKQVGDIPKDIAGVLVETFFSGDWISNSERWDKCERLA